MSRIGLLLKKLGLRKSGAPTEAPAPLPPLGEPDDIVVVNPTRLEDPLGIVKVYRKERLLVYGNARIPMDAIVDFSFSNVSNPYLPSEYHLLLRLADGRVLHVPAGPDAAFAEEVLQELRQTIAQ